MKKMLLGIVASMALMASACTSVHSTKVDGSTIASNGEAVAVVQTDTIGFSLIFHLIVLGDANLDAMINKQLVTEAKALGGNRVQLLSAWEWPKNSILHHLLGGIVALPPAHASGIAVR